MRLHILGVCGTFMGSLALLAKQCGHEVSGSDAGVYPPMSTQLEAQGITCLEGYQAEHLQPAPDLVIIGNALSRGNAAVEYVLNHDLPYMSGPQWLAQEILRGRWTLAVAGTHGKTSTASMLAWILEYAGLQPGFLIGGVTQNFGVSARYSASRFFVVEADEYDTAFFDKRSKFIHYAPRTLVLNNLEFDHADIFPDLAAIQRQFHHLVRTVPGEGLIIHNASQTALDEVLRQGCWTPLESFGTGTSQWRGKALNADHSEFEVYFAGDKQGHVAWQLAGDYNQDNALAAIAAARHVGVPVAVACEALRKFEGVKRRLELRGTVNNIRIYDDFAHHPTAIELTLKALRRRVGGERIIVVLEPRSNTMRMGVHKDRLVPALVEADVKLVYHAPQNAWDFPVASDIQVYNCLETLIDEVVNISRSGDHILIMSNGGFGDIHAKLLKVLA